MSLRRCVPKSYWAHLTFPNLLDVHVKEHTRTLCSGKGLSLQSQLCNLTTVNLPLSTSSRLVAFVSVALAYLPGPTVYLETNTFVSTSLKYLSKIHHSVCSFRWNSITDRLVIQGWVVQKPVNPNPGLDLCNLR